MFYKMIESKRNEWDASQECPVISLVDYMQRTGQLRDAQIDAIKTYLYLKTACECKPLAQLFTAGQFNNLNLDEIALSANTRAYLQENPAAAALLEYSMLKNDAGEQVSPALEQMLKEHPDSVDCNKFFVDAFYGVSYTDYLFSLPMGAGKTFLMAAFIYLDLYFAANEPHNKAFAHNFIVFAPSGLKSSVVPSLKTIQRFDPSWVLPEPAASDIKRKIAFEVLDQNKTASKSNKTKNPNVQKIASHQPLNELFGLVAVTNAEKVILDQIKETDGQIDILDDSEDNQANELRHLIGKIPALSIFIDEVHHAVSSADKKQERKLRAVVSRWAEKGSVNAVVGFSGTPYLDHNEKIEITDTLSVGTDEITNIVYYYPLIDGVGNFLKRPVVKIEDTPESYRIIHNGVHAFLDTYKDTVYADGTTAKLGIYCGNIAKLEEQIYPQVCGIVEQYGLDASCILRFYRESSSKDKSKKKYVAPADSQMLFDTLDKPISPIRIVLLVQIGKEGWDCRSLTGIVLSQESECPTNMVLQTSCRCLRQVEKGTPETALIYLNADNGDKLIAQLQQQHHITLKQFTDANHSGIKLKRYDRTAYLKLPKIDFYQLKVSYDTLVTEEADPAANIPNAVENTGIQASTVQTTDFTAVVRSIDIDDEERGAEPAMFTPWLNHIAKCSFGTLTMAELKKHEAALEQVFDTITYVRDGKRFFSSKYRKADVESNIRKAFCDKRDFTTTTDVIPEDASLLKIGNFTPEISIDVGKKDDYYPAQDLVERIILDDKGKLKPDAKTQQMIALAEETGNTEIAETLRRQNSSHPQKNRSFHYLPYHTDSSFEQTFLKEVLPLTDIENYGLEVYYNGDKALTELKIKCYKATGKKWSYIGMYTPDFLIIQRKDGKIHKAIIVETKGEAYEAQFADKKTFMEAAFLQQNNEKFGYRRFDFLYLPDTLTDNERINQTHQKICEFFGE